MKVFEINVDTYDRFKEMEDLIERFSIYGDINNHKHIYLKIRCTETGDYLNNAMIPDLVLKHLRPYIKLVVIKSIENGLPKVKGNEIFFRYYEQDGRLFRVSDKGIVIDITPNADFKYEQVFDIDKAILINTYSINEADRACKAIEDFKSRVSEINRIKRNTISIDNSTIEMINRYCSSGDSINSIAKRFNISRATVRKYATLPG